MKKQFFIPACLLSAAAVGFVIFAMGHPELSFPWDGWITGILYSPKCCSFPPRRRNSSV